MLKKLLKYLSFVLVTFLLVVVVYLGPAHWQIRQLTAPLPASDDIPGLAAYKAAGHTPGSTIFFAAVDDHLWVTAGDIANNMESVQNNLPKPLAYSLFLTPEDMTRLEDLRLWLAELNTDPGISVVVSHDLEPDLRIGIPLWTGR